MLDISQKLRLVRFDRHDVVALLIDESLAELPLAVQGISDDEFAVQYEIADQGLGPLNFVGLRGNGMTRHHPSQDQVHPHE